MRNVAASRRIVLARRAVQGIIAYSFVPWSETGTDCRLGLMDPGYALPSSARKKNGQDVRLLPPGPPSNKCGRSGEIPGGEIPAVRTLPVTEGDGDMPEDIGAVMGNPRDEILRYPRLVPAPLLAASPALPALLVLRHTIVFIWYGQGFRLRLPRGPHRLPENQPLSQTENIYNKMSNILYKYQCVTARVLQYSQENTKNTSSN